MMKRLVLSGVFLLSLLSVTAQHTVSGIVSDKKDNTKLLSEVSVYMPEFNRQDFSKEGGTYILRNVGIGKVTIQFTKVGYRPLVKVIDTKDSATVLNVELEPSAEELQEVSVTADRISSSTALPFATTIVSGSELRKTGVLHPLAALSFNPGIDRITQGNGIQRPVIRGLSGTNIINYQYGVRLENQAWDELQDLEVNDAGTDYVEVVKGPASLLYGPNAMGGVLVWNEEKPPVAGHISGRVDAAFHTNTAGFETGLNLKGASKKGLFRRSRKKSD
jgi:iron complex outermembrane receptor protein